VSLVWRKSNVYPRSWNLCSNKIIVQVRKGNVLIITETLEICYRVKEFQDFLDMKMNWVAHILLWLGSYLYVQVNCCPWPDLIINFIFAGLFYFWAELLSKKYFFRYRNIPQYQQQQQQQQLKNNNRKIYIIIELMLQKFKKKLFTHKYKHFTQRTLFSVHCL
jgi:hypothetical protein